MKNRNEKLALDWTHLFDADLEQHLEIRHAPGFDARMHRYIEAMIAFQDGEISDLDRIIGEASVKDETGEIDMKLLLTIRLCGEIRRHAVEPQTLRQAENFAKRDKLWAGELYAFISAGHEAMGRLQEARSYAILAFESLKAIGAKKKSVRLLRNAMSFDRVMHPEKHFLPDLKFLFLEAKRAEDKMAMASALTEISREHMRLGKIQYALKYANIAVAAFHGFQREMGYFLALAQRARVHCLLKQFAEARLDAELASGSSADEVHLELSELAKKYPLLEKALRSKEDSLDDVYEAKNKTLRKPKKKSA